MLRIVTFKVDEHLLRALDAYARKYRMSRSEAIREAIKMLLKSSGIEVKREATPIKSDNRSLVIEIDV